MSQTSCSFGRDKTIFVRLTLQRGLQRSLGIWPCSRMQLSPHAKSCSSESAGTILVTTIYSMLIGPSSMGLCGVFQVKESATLLSIGLPIRTGPDSAAANQALYPDGTHPSQGGQSNMEADYFRPALISLCPLT